MEKGERLSPGDWIAKYWPMVLFVLGMLVWAGDQQWGKAMPAGEVHRVADQVADIHEWIRERDGEGVPLGWGRTLKEPLGELAGTVVDLAATMETISRTQTRMLEECRGP